MIHVRHKAIILVLLIFLGAMSVTLYSCRPNYRQAAQAEYDTLLDAWYNQQDKHKAMWYQGNALDTLIDYVSITQDQERGKDLGEKIAELWAAAEQEGAWWDDFGWWGIAFLNAARNFEILAQEDASEYLGNAADCLENHMDKATEVWRLAYAPPCDVCITQPPASWYRYEPRFPGGVWNAAFAGLTPGPQQGCNPNLAEPPPDPNNPIPVGTPGDFCSLLSPVQNTVTNGLFMVLNARYYMQNLAVQEDRSEQTLAIYEWFRGWMDVPDEATTLCSGNQVKPSLLNGETGLVRERVGTYARDMTQSSACFTRVKWYEPELSWAGDQGIVLGGLVDVLNSGLTEDRFWLTSRALGILSGVMNHMTKKMNGGTHDDLAAGLLRPWTRFDGWGSSQDPNGPFVSDGGFGFGDPDYPVAGTPEYENACSCTAWKDTEPCPVSPPKIPLDGDTDYVAGPGIFMRYLLHAYNNSWILRKRIQRCDYRAFLKTNADAIARDSYSCSCRRTIDSGTFDTCNLSCQITRLATLNAAVSILGP